MPKETDAARFWAKVEKTENCWWWIAGRTPGGYGQFQMDGRPHPAHRVAWMLTNGRPIPAGLHVLHACDNPPCVRPEHLRLGTVADNMADKAAHGRVNKQPRVVPSAPYRPGASATITQAAELLGLSPSTLRVQIHKGRLKGRKVGRDWQISAREIERYRAESKGRRHAAASMEARS